MLKGIIAGLAGAVLVTVAVPAAAAQKAATFTTVEARKVLDTYCVTCHNDRMKANFGNLSLQAVDLSEIGRHAPELEKVVRKLQSAAMPPAGSKRPDAATYAAMTAWMSGQLDQYAAARPNAGRTEAMHRLNRAEYQNAIRDLLGVEGLQIDQMLPADDESYGFDNIAGILAISPTHLERYLVAARKISRTAVGDVTIAPYGETQMIPLDLGQDQQLENLAPGTRGGTAVKRYFPVDGEYVIRFQTVSGYGTSEDEPNYVEVTIDGERIFYTKVDQRKAKGNDDEASTNYEIKVPVKGGLRLVAMTFLETTAAQAEDYLQPYLRPPTVSIFKHARLGSYVGPYISMLSFTGPMSTSGPGDTPSRRKIFVCRPARAAEEAPCARRILGTLARRAYRRPVAAPDVDTLMSFYKEGRSEGSFDKGIRTAIQRILTSPDFLFRVEQQPKDAAADAPYRVSDLTLASRLSFFLWSSIPDETLIALAAAGRLHDPAVLAQQTKRMLADPKAAALVDNFAGQWLRLRNVQAVLRDTRMFPDFDENLRRDFRRETELFFKSIITEDRSVLDLIDANYSFVNERLARHYDVPNVYGSQFRRVTFADARRGGLLGQGSILTATAKPDRTSPVQRGKWILESLLGAPPPPPPPDVPALDETSVTGTLRQRMELHRKNPVCASCHKMMDPLGFSLENYDAIGAWRTHEGSVAVDAEGAMPDGTAFTGAAGLRKALLAKPDVFVTALTEKLMVYALGRGIEFYDEPAVRGIVRTAAAQKFRFSSIILAIVNSLPFQMRQS
jgi:mono/diheme cytochrome c family protein